MTSTTALEWLGLALYRLIFLLGLFNLCMGILGFLNRDLMQAVYRKLFRIDVSGIKPAVDEEDAEVAKALDPHFPKPLAEEASDRARTPADAAPSAASSALLALDRARAGAALAGVAVDGQHAGGGRVRLAAVLHQPQFHTRRVAHLVGDVCQGERLRMVRRVERPPAPTRDDAPPVKPEADVPRLFRQAVDVCPALGSR
jgi:hypothetical protein